MIKFKLRINIVRIIGHNIWLRHFCNLLFFRERKIRHDCGPVFLSFFN